MKRALLFTGILLTICAAHYAQSEKTYKVSSGKYHLKYRHDTLHQIRFKSKIPFRNIFYTVSFPEDKNDGMITVTRHKGGFIRLEPLYYYSFYFIGNKILDSYDGDDQYFYLYDYDNYPKAYISLPRYGRLNFEGPKGCHYHLFDILMSELEKQKRPSVLEGKIPVICYFPLTNILKNYSDNEELMNLVNTYLDMSYYPAN